MTDREKLIELVDEAVYAPHKEVCAIADHLIANGVVVQEWIPVTERLPEDMQERVLVMTLGNHPIGNQKMDTDRYRNDSWVRYGKEVTHWMPLPEPPMRKGENG